MAAILHLLTLRCVLYPLHILQDGKQRHHLIGQQYSCTTTWRQNRTKLFQLSRQLESKNPFHSDHELLRQGE